MSKIAKQCTDLEKQYITAYKKHPENTRESEALMKVGLESFSKSNAKTRY